MDIRWFSSNAGVVLPPQELKFHAERFSGSQAENGERRPCSCVYDEGERRAVDADAQPDVVVFIEFERNGKRVLARGEARVKTKDRRSGGRIACSTLGPPGSLTGFPPQSGKRRRDRQRHVILPRADFYQLEQLSEDFQLRIAATQVSSDHAHKRFQPALKVSSFVLR